MSCLGVAVRGAQGKNQRRMDLQADFLGHLEMPFEVVQIVQPVKYRQPLDSALLEAFD